jgi:hypothetical protein
LEDEDFESMNEEPSIKIKSKQNKNVQDEERFKLSNMNLWFLDKEVEEGYQIYYQLKASKANWAIHFIGAILNLLIYLNAISKIKYAKDLVQVPIIVLFLIVIFSTFLFIVSMFIKVKMDSLEEKTDNIFDFYTIVEGYITLGIYFNAFYFLFGLVFSIDMINLKLASDAIWWQLVLFHSLLLICMTYLLLHISLIVKMFFNVLIFILSITSNIFLYEKTMLYQTLYYHISFSILCFNVMFLIELNM